MILYASCTWKTNLVLTVFKTAFILKNGRLQKFLIFKSVVQSEEPLVILAMLCIFRVSIIS